MSSHERRKHHRATVSAHVDLHSGSNFYAAETRDLSAGGLFIETRAPLPMGSTVHVRLTMLGKKYEVAAEVAWLLCDDAGEPIGFGARFTELKKSVRKAILHFMEHREPMAFAMLEADDAEPEPDAESELSVEKIDEQWPPPPSSPAYDPTARATLPTGVMPSQPPPPEPPAPPSGVQIAELADAARPRPAPPPLPWTPSTPPKVAVSLPPRFVPGSQL